jgi:hypothetical protein
MGHEDSFRESCKWLRSKDAQSNYTSSHKASRKARVSKTEEDTPKMAPGDLDFLVNYTNANYNSNCSANNGREMAVPFLLWKLLSSETQQAIRDARGDPTRGNFRGKRGGILLPFRPLRTYPSLLL